MTATEEKKGSIEHLGLRNMPDTARIWIYQSNRAFSDTEKEALTLQIKDFLGKWTVHSKTLLSAGAVFYNQFIVLSVDESLNEASGCSIDASVYFIKEIEKQYDVQLFDRMNFAYWDGKSVKTVSSSALPKLYTEGGITDETLFFDNLVNTAGALRKDWMKPLKSSWHRRFV